MKVIKALRNSFRYAKLGSAVGAVLGAAVATLDDKNGKPADTAASGTAIGAAAGAVFGFGSSLVDDHYAKVYSQQ